MTGSEVQGVLKRAQEHLAQGAPREFIVGVLKHAGLGQLAVLEGFGLGGEYLVSNDATKSAIKELEEEKKHKSRATRYNVTASPATMAKMRQHPEATSYLEKTLKQLSNVKEAAGSVLLGQTAGTPSLAQMANELQPLNAGWETPAGRQQRAQTSIRSGPPKATIIS